MLLFLEPAIACPLFFVLGLVLGSFGNVVADRIPAGESLGGRSHCESCNRTLRLWELIPVFSWLALRGRCARCGATIPARFALIECASGLLFAAAVHAGGFLVIPSLLLALAFWAMLLIMLVDLRTQLIPDILTIILAVSALGYQLVIGGNPLIATLIGPAFFGVQWLVSRGKWVGSGDVFLSGALGLLLGTWPLSLIGLFLAYISGAAVAVIGLITKKVTRSSHIPFGPFLILGTLASFFMGNQILTLLFFTY